MKAFRGPAKFGALLFLLWTVWTSSTAKGQAIGDLRLVDSPDEYSGTLEYFVSGVWGRVCPAGWDAQSTAVACRQLGFTGGVSAFSNVDEIMVNWTATPLFNAIQGITCNGTESRLIECTLDSGSAGSCTEVEFLGIVCTNHSEGDVRLTDNGGSAGVVEVYTAGDWHPVCADNAWGATTVNRLCIDLGHTSGTVETAQPLLSNTVIRTNVSCTTDSGHLSECLPDNLVLSSSSDCLSNTVLTVACEATTGDLRLLGGPQPNVGQLEMWFNGEWAAPCASEWNSQAATIACSELGFAGVSSWFSTALETFAISGPSGRGGAVSVTCSGPNTNVINCQTSAGTCQPNERVILVCEGTTLEPQFSTSSIEASASEINVIYSLRSANAISNAARADHDRLRSLTLTYNLRSVMDTYSPETVSAQAVSRVGSQIVATFPVSATEELQPYFVYEMEMSLAVRGEMGPLSNTVTFIRGLEADVTVELSATTARFSWPLVTSAQVPVLGYTISIEAVDPPGLISIAPVNTLPQQNSHLQSGLEEGVRYRFLLHATTSLQQDMLVPNQHEGEFTTDTAAPTGTPQEVVIEQITSAAVTISWQAPVLIDQNGEITHYVITYQPSGSSNQMEEFVMSVPGNELRTNFTYNHMLQGLVSGTEYSVQVAAATTGGTGPSVRHFFNTPEAATEPVAESLDTVDPLPYALVAVGLVVLLVLVIVLVLVVAILLWNKKRTGSYSLKNLRSNFWVSTPRATSLTQQGNQQEDDSPTTGMGVFSPSIHEAPTGNSYDSLTPKEIEAIVAGSEMRGKAYSFPYSKTDNVGSSQVNSSLAIAQESENYAPALVNASDNEASPQIHVYEDPVNVTRKASTLPTQQRYLMDPSDYLLPSPTEKSMSANLQRFIIPGGQRELYYEVPPGVQGSQYANNPDVAAPQYSNTLDMSELESMRDHVGYSPVWSHSKTAEEKKDLSQDGKHSSLSNSVQYATPKKFPVVADGVAGSASPTAFGYEVMPTSPEPPEPSDTHYAYTSSTPVPEHLQ